MKLNLGCGKDYIDGWVNVDLYDDSKCDVVYDLEKFPWPWEDNSVSEILIKHFNSELDFSQLILFFKRYISCSRILIFSAISKGIIINIREKVILQYPFLLTYQLYQILKFYLVVALA